MLARAAKILSLSSLEIEILGGFVSFGASVAGLITFALAALALVATLVGELLRA